MAKYIQMILDSYDIHNTVTKPPSHGSNCSASSGRVKGFGVS